MAIPCTGLCGGQEVLDRDRDCDCVCCGIAFEATVGSKHYEFPNNGHLCQFNAAGKTVKYDHVTDTAQMIRMAKGE